MNFDVFGAEEQSVCIGEKKAFLVASSRTVPVALCSSHTIIPNGVCSERV